MRQRRETPEPWAGAMQRAEIRSLNHLADKTGVAVQTLSRLVHGEGEASAHTIDRVASVLRPADARRVAEWAGQRWNHEQLALPDAARHLTAKQWAAVVAVINSMAEPESRGSVTSLAGRRARTGAPSARDAEAQVDEAAMEEPRRGRPRRTPPGESEEPYTER